MTNRIILLWTIGWFAVIPFYRAEKWDTRLKTFMRGSTLVIFTVASCVSAFLLGTSAALVCTDGAGWDGLMVIDRIELMFLPIIFVTCILTYLIEQCVLLWSYDYVTLSDLNDALVDGSDSESETRTHEIGSVSSESSVEPPYVPLENEELYTPDEISPMEEGIL